MKLLRLIFLASAVVASAFAQTAGVTKSLATATTNEITGDLVFPAGRTLTVNGTLSGTPAGGTLNLANVTVTPPSNIVTTTGNQTLTNKTLTAPVISSISNTGTISLPTSTTTLVGRDTVDTLTNKSIDAGQLTGTVAAGRMPALSGDVSTSAGSISTTLATVNANEGSFGSATQAGTFTVNAKGLVTSASAVTVTPAVGSITGLGTGVSTFLATPSSANLAAAVTDETGTGALVLANSPTLTTPSIGAATGSSLSLTGLSSAQYSLATGSLASFSSATGGLYSSFAGSVGVLTSVSDNSGTFAPLYLKGSSLQFWTGGSSKLNIDASGNATLTGNLTVSGTGTHAFSGPGKFTGINRALTVNDNAGNAEIYFQQSNVDKIRIGTTGATNNFRIRDDGVGRDVFAYDTATNVITFGSALNTPSTTASTSTTTGALVVSGGVGIAGNVNVGGNLTVSGTSVSSVRGSMLIGDGGTALDYYGAYIDYGNQIAGWAGIWLRQTTTRNATTVALASDGNTVVLNAPSGKDLLFRIGNGTQAGIKGTSGNFLLGTTTDSSNGRLQLATHTTSAGGIGFGTATSLYTEAAGTLSLNHSAGDARLYFYNTGVAQGKIESASSNFYVTASAGSLILRSGGPVTALTLDSSQRCILAGALRLNNAYVAGAPTATGYVTIQDSNGNTYKVLVAP